MAELVRVRRLTDQEGRKLQQIVRRGSANSVRYRRAMMLLASAGGNRVPVIAQLVPADEDTVRDVIHRFNEIGLDCLDSRWARNRPRLLRLDDEDYVVQTATTCPTKLGQPFTHWSIRKLTAYLRRMRGRVIRIGREALRCLLLRRGITFPTHQDLEGIARPRTRRQARPDRAGTGPLPGPGLCGFHEMGMGAATVQAQIAADALGIAYEKVRVEYGDTALPTGPMAGNSNQTATVATSVLAACAELTRKVTALARRAGTTGQEPAAALRAAGRPFLEASVGSDTRRGLLGSQGRFLTNFLKDQRWSKAARGAQLCEVRVNVDTGELRISRWLGMFDVGRIINPKTATSQLRGAVVMGIGMALSEQSLIDPRSGRTMSAGLDSYYVPVHADIPRSTSTGWTSRTSRCPWESSNWAKSA